MFLIMGKVQTILSVTPLWLKMIVNRCENLQISLTVVFQNAAEMVLRLLNPRPTKYYHSLKVPCNNRKQCCLFHYNTVFWYIWDHREHKRKTETARNPWHYHAYAANQLSGLFFISLFPGQNGDHVAFQTQQYCMIDRKKQFLSSPLKRWDFNLICKGLIQLNMRFSLLYPEKLLACSEDSSKLFEIPQGALDFWMLCPGIQIKIDLEITMFLICISYGKSKQRKAKYRHLLWRVCQYYSIPFMEWLFLTRNQMRSHIAKKNPHLKHKARRQISHQFLKQYVTVVPLSQRVFYDLSWASVHLAHFFEF